MAERSDKTDDPLNLMRVMPTKGGASRTGRFSAMRFLRMAYFLTSDYTDEDG